MPDIAMCQSKTCPSATQCRRHTDSGTIPHPTWQSWADFDHGDHDSCDEFLPIYRKEP